LRHPDPDDLDAAAPRRPGAAPPGGPGGGDPEGVTANVRAFRVMVRNELFRWVELLARGAHVELSERLGPGEWPAARLDEAMASYREEHAGVGTGPDARGGALFLLDESPAGGAAGAAGASGGERTERSWTVRQVLDDPDGDHDWALHARVDLAASDEAGRAVVVLVAIAPVARG
jgi:hypothetical protein